MPRRIPESAGSGRRRSGTPGARRPKVAGGLQAVWFAGRPTGAAAAGLGAGRPDEWWATASVVVHRPLFTGCYFGPGTARGDRIGVRRFRRHLLEYHGRPQALEATETSVVGRALAALHRRVAAVIQPGPPVSRVRLRPSFVGQEGPRSPATMSVETARSVRDGRGRCAASGPVHLAVRWRQFHLISADRRRLPLPLGRSTLARF